MVEHLLYFIFQVQMKFYIISFDALTLSVGCQKTHMACKKPMPHMQRLSFQNK